MRSRPAIDLIRGVLVGSRSTKGVTFVLCIVAWAAALVWIEGPLTLPVLLLATSLTTFGLVGLPFSEKEVTPISSCREFLLKLALLGVMLWSIPGALAVLALAYPVLLLLNIALLIILVPLRLASGWTVRFLAGEDRLRFAVIVVAVVSLMAGFVLQLVATF